MPRASSESGKWLDDLLFPNGGKPAPKACAVTVSFGGNDAAFQEDWQGESVRILRALADKIERGSFTKGDVIACLDVNGNNIGSARIS